MNNVEKKLDLIGFKNFVNLNKNERDGIERKVYNTYYKDAFLSIKIKKDNNFWVIESFEGQEIVKKLIDKNSELNIDDIIEFFKKFYFSDDFSNQI